MKEMVSLSKRYDAALTPIPHVFLEEELWLVAYMPASQMTMTLHSDLYIVLLAFNISRTGFFVQKKKKKNSPPHTAFAFFF